MWIDLFFFSDIRGLHTRETWALQMDDQGGITTLVCYYTLMIRNSLFEFEI